MRILRLRRALRTTNPAVAVSFVAQTSILTVIAALGLSMRVIVSERNDPHRQSLGPIWDLLRRVVYPWADVVTANSRGALDTLAEFVARDRLLYVPNPLTRTARLRSDGLNGADDPHDWAIEPSKGARCLARGVCPIP